MGGIHLKLVPVCFRGGPGVPSVDVSTPAQRAASLLGAPPPLPGPGMTLSTGLWRDGEMPGGTPAELDLPCQAAPFPV